MIGQTIAHYEILELLGKGGMGEVYRARDPRLGRDVAIKVLPARLVANADARIRFEREARAVAALSHPNILAIHDVGEHDGHAYAVTELLEGKTLYEELAEGPIPLRHALEIGGQIADGLAAAHDKGIVHRDIKPANVFLTNDGRTKILDFGLAKAGIANTDETLAGAVADSTTPGTVLGTVRYMAPEQVRGEAVDHRADIFAFGSLLWEMLSGRPAFDRDSAVETMNAILKEDPAALEIESEGFPPSVERILHRCLAKVPEQRFQSAQDLGFALRNVQESSSRVGVSGIQTARPTVASSKRVWWVGAALLVLGLVGGFLIGRGGGEAPAREPLKIVNMTHSGLDYSPSASPDGRTIAFVSSRDGIERIWLRQLDGGVEAPLTKGRDISPAFSPDGSSVLFLREEGLMLSAFRVSVVGGAARKLLENVAGACWSPDGESLAFTRGGGTSEEPVANVGVFDLSSGEERFLCSFDATFLYGIEWSPDGRWISVVGGGAVMNSTRNEIILIDAETGDPRIIHRAPTRMSQAVWTPDGKEIVFAESTSLLGDISGAMGLCYRMDPFEGTKTPLFWINSVWAGAMDFASFGFIGDNSLIFDEILWRGNLSEARMDPDTGQYDRFRPLTQGNARDRQPAFDAANERIVFSSNRSGNLDIWTLEVATGLVRQITDDDAQDWDPAFTADGRSIIWSSNRGGHLEIWTSRVDGSGARQVTQDGVDAENPTQSADGRWIYYSSANPQRQGIWRIPSDGGEEELIAGGVYLLPEVSPDGRYVAYNAIDPDNLEAIILVNDVESREIVFRTTVPIRGFQRLISSGRVRWSPDSKLLVFVGPFAGDRTVILAQDFRPGQDTRDTRRVLVELDSQQNIESFGIAPDGASIILSHVDHVRSLRMADNVFETPLR